jgi:hypothetical protein
MKINTYQQDLHAVFGNPEPVIREESLLANAGEELMGMALCYRDDGDRFLLKGDPVNALASYAYASGWIDTGCFIGLFNKTSPCRDLISGVADIPGHLSVQLKEKTLRYERLLFSAIGSCECAAEPGIGWYDGGQRVIIIAETYGRGGKWLARSGREADALACFSYGHGWLDASLRVGLIRITGNKELFAI